MTKPKLCKWEGCKEEAVNFPNSSIKRKYCQEHAIKAVLEQKRIESIKDKEELEKARQTLKKRTPRELFYSSTAWKHFSQYILLLYADENLEVRCATDPSLIYPVNSKFICVGHWQKVFDANSTNYSVAFDERNVLPQSVQQNVHFSGNMEEMGKAINRIHGEGTTDLILQKKREPLKLDKDYLDKVASTYLQKKKQLLSERGLSDPWGTKRY